MAVSVRRPRARSPRVIAAVAGGASPRCHVVPALEHLIAREGPLRAIDQGRARVLYSAPMKRLAIGSVLTACALGVLSPAAAQTPPSTSTVTFTGLRVVPSPAANIVRNVFLRSRARFAACAPAGTAGSVSLRMATDANGQVSTSTMRRSSFAGDELAVARCVVAASRAMRFPGSVQGTLDIEVNVVLGTPDAGAAPSN